MNIDRAVNKALKTCGELLVNEAKKNITAQGLVSEDNGLLRNSVNYRIEGDTLIVGSNLFWAVWKEWGTGSYAIHGDGRQGWWVYVDTGNNSLLDYTPSQQPIRTQQEAIDCCNYLRSQGLNAFYTNGEPPKPWLQPALDNNKQLISEIIASAIMEGEE